MISYIVECEVGCLWRREEVVLWRREYVIIYMTGF